MQLFLVEKKKKSSLNKEYDIEKMEGVGNKEDNRKENWEERGKIPHSFGQGESRQIHKLFEKIMKKDFTFILPSFMKILKKVLLQYYLIMVVLIQSFL